MFKLHVVCGPLLFGFSYLIVAGSLVTALNCDIKTDNDIVTRMRDHLHNLNKKNLSCSLQHFDGCLIVFLPFLFVNYSADEIV